MNGWQEILRLQAKLRKERQIAEQRRQEQVEEMIMLGLGIAIVLVVTVFIVWFISAVN